MAKRRVRKNRVFIKKFAKAISRGAKVREKMIAEEGGSKSLDEIARLTGKSEKFLVNLHRSGRLIGWSRNEILHFPIWQFVKKRPLRGLGKVLKMLTDGDVLDEWGKLGFFLLNHGLLDERRPLDLLRKNKLKPVLKAAEAYGS